MKKVFAGKTSWVIGAAVLSVFACGFFLVRGAGGEDCPFSNSLHRTSEGMRFWYEERGGFANITHIPYASDKLDCQNCHVTSCGVCHTKKEGKKCFYDSGKAAKMDTCLACHKREKATFGIGEKTGTLDVHVEMGMGCMDCHSIDEVHGDGTFYRSMRGLGAVKTSCENCHPSKEGDIQAHTVHKGKLDCSACHVSNSLVCLNCHFDSVVKDQSRAGNFFPPEQSWTLLMNYKGKVTAGSMQSLVFDEQRFIAYAPFFTHAVQAKGKGCDECHANPAVERIRNGQPVPMAEFKDGKMVSWQGVVPLVPDQLEWVFLDKEGEKWVPIESGDPIVTQLAGYGTPLSNTQLKELGKPH